MTDSAAPTTASEDVLRRSREAVAGVSTGVFVDGEWAEAASGRRFDVVDPATEEVVATVADGGPEDAARAIEAALSERAALSARARARIEARHGLDAAAATLRDALGRLAG